jgi:uncharacterized cupredoxin-like copper-binding protein
VPDVYKQLLTSTVLTAFFVVALSTAAMAEPAGAIVNVTLRGDKGEDMRIQLDRDTVPAGPVIFAVTNAARATEHEIQVIKDNPAHASLPTNTAGNRVLEERVAKIGEVSELRPGAQRTKRFTLKPGRYLLICNVPGHYTMGMTAMLTVAQ